MKTLYELLMEKGKIEAAVWLQQFADMPAHPIVDVLHPVRPHDIWVVGGAARWLLSGGALPEPTDIDLLINIEPLGNASADAILEQEYDESQKSVNGGVNFDVFRNRLTVWLRGAPCVGDQVAIRLKDNFVLADGAAFVLHPATKNPRWSGDSQTYFDKHVLGLIRDARAFHLYRLSLGEDRIGSSPATQEAASL